MKKKYLREKEYVEQLEEVKDPPTFLYEFVTVADLVDEAAISPLTSKHLSRREILAGDAKNNIYLKGALVEDNAISFNFSSFATVEAYDDNHEFKRVTKNHRMKRNPQQEYELYLKFLDTETWTKNMVHRGEIGEDDIAVLVKNAYVQCWNTSPAFHYQGHNYWASELDASIFPTNIQPTKWDTKHPETQLDKHLAQLLYSLPDYYEAMAKEVKKELRLSSKR